jgi:hypothetical protein
VCSHGCGNIVDFLLASLHKCLHESKVAHSANCRPGALSPALSAARITAAAASGSCFLPVLRDAVSAKVSNQKDALRIATTCRCKTNTMTQSRRTRRRRRIYPNVYRKT